MDKIRILGKSFRIEYGTVGAEDIAEERWDLGVLRFRPTLPRDMLRQLIWHEVFHAGMGILSVPHCASEPIVSSLAEIVDSVLRENLPLINKLYGKEKK